MGALPPSSRAAGFRPRACTGHAVDALRAAAVPSRARGFTLLEMVAVLMLVAIIGTAVSVSLVRSMSSTKVMAASRDLAAAMRYTRGQAIVKREERTLLIDAAAKQYTAPDKAAVSLPEEMDISVLAARIEQTAEQTVGIRFFPDGSSTGGRVRLTSGQREWEVNVAWLTGEIALSEIRR